MSPPAAGELPRCVAQFLHEVTNFERETFALRHSGRPHHLQKIKIVTQALINQALILIARLEDASLPEIKHLRALIRDCERSGRCLLTYLHKLVANTRATILPNSREPILVDLKWAPIRNLINKLRGLRASMEAAGLSGHYNNQELVHLTAPIGSVYSSGAYLSIERNQIGTQTHDGLPHTGACDPPLEIPAGDYRDTATLIGGHNPCRTSQSPSSSRQNIMPRIFDHRNLQYAVDAAQVLLLCIEWDRIFSQQPLPALVLYHTTKPSEAALNAPVSQLDNKLNLYSLLCFNRSLQSCCGELLEICGPEGFHDKRLELLGSSMNVDCDQAIVVYADELMFESLRSREISDLIDSARRDREFDPLNHLASACLMVIKSTNPFRSTIFQRCLLYLAHLLRQGTFSAESTQRYLDAIAETIAQSQTRDMTRPIPWSTLPQVGDFLHFKPEFQCYTDILTFAAREALPLAAHLLPTYDESRRRFAITAHALSSWASCLPDSHPDKIFEPSLQKRQEILRYLLTHLTPPESTVCCGRYGLWNEAIRLCNSGHVKEPIQLLAIFLTKAYRPDLLWSQAVRPSVEMGWNASEVLNALRGEASGAVAPQLFETLLGEVEQMQSQTKRRSGQRVQEQGSYAEWKGW